MEQVLQLLFGSWAGQLTLLILLFMFSMMGYFIYLFMKTKDQDNTAK